MLKDKAIHFAKTEAHFLPNGEFSMRHHVVDGISNNSHGIDVAELAGKIGMFVFIKGLPSKVIERARQFQQQQQQNKT